jgi:replication-associated recombination protein RarA
MGGRPIVHTVNGHELGDVVSAFQKSVRRGLTHDALYFAVDLDLSGYGEYCWTRMLVMASEDVGLADPDVCVRINALYSTYTLLKKKKNDHCPERLMLVHAVLELANADKSRLVDTSLISHYGEHAGLYRDIPDYALDGHTRRGRMSMKNDKAKMTDFFYDTSTVVETYPAQSQDWRDLEPAYRNMARKFQTNGGELPGRAVPGQQRML